MVSSPVEARAGAAEKSVAAIVAAATAPERAILRESLMAYPLACRGVPATSILLSSRV